MGSTSGKIQADKTEALALNKSQIKY